MKIDATVMNVFGIPPYIFFAGIGAIAAFLCYNCLMLHLDTDIKKGNRAAVLSMPALLVGAKLFGIIANIVESLVWNKAINIKTFIYSGIVFYGGLLFFLICFLRIIRKAEVLERNKIIDSLAVSIPLFHVFGRIGCFTAGCCYGISTRNVIGVIYTTWVNGEVLAERRIPIQLIEAFLNILIFLILLWMALCKKQKGRLLNIYLLTYSGIRFVDEFFRGDVNRSILFGFTAAQVISVVLIVIVLSDLLRERRGKRV